MISVYRAAAPFDGQ